MEETSVSLDVALGAGAAYRRLAGGEVKSGSVEVTVNGISWLSGTLCRFMGAAADGSSIGGLPGWLGVSHRAGTDSSSLGVEEGNAPDAVGSSEDKEE